MKQFAGIYQVNDYESMRRSLSLQVTAVFAPERFDLEMDYVPKNGNERHILHLLKKHHPKEKIWRK
jgi:hypothetical protein